MAESELLVERADGVALLTCGIQDIGTGTYTILGQIASEILGLPIEDVIVHLGDAPHPETGKAGEPDLPSAQQAIDLLVLLQEKTRGNLTTNDGEIAVNWALDGHGILMRAEWDIARYLKSGRLVQVLPQCHTPDADIHAVYPQHLQMATRVRAFVDFVAKALARPG